MPLVYNKDQTLYTIVRPNWQVLPIPNGLRDQIAYGDLVGAALALLCILALSLRLRAAVALAWLFTAATFLDLSNALAGGIRHDMMGEVHDVRWLILCFYVPALWITLALIIWQLVSRRGESVASRERKAI